MYIMYFSTESEIYLNRTKQLRSCFKYIEKLQEAQNQTSNVCHSTQ